MAVSLTVSTRWSSLTAARLAWRPPREPSRATAAEREGGREGVVDAAKGTHHGRRIDQDGCGRHRRRVPVDHGRICGIDRGGVAEAAMLSNKLAAVDGAQAPHGADRPKPRETVRRSRMRGRVLQLLTTP